MRCRGSFSLTNRSCVVVWTLLLAALACRDTSSPTGPEPSPRLTASAATLSFQQVSAGGFHACGVTSAGQAYCWGDNDFGALGTGSNTGPEACSGAVGPFPCSTRPVLVVGGHRFHQVSVGSLHTCGVTTDSRAYCWGPNDWGQLGDGTTTARLQPVAVAGGLRFRQIDAGDSHTCAVTTGNRAFCWGNNDNGQLGDGSRTRRLKPVAVSGGLSFKQVSAGIGAYGFSCGLTADSRAFCWGANNFAQLGDSTSVFRRAKPALVAGGQSFRQLDAGYAHACGVTTGHQAFCWGDGRGGALGDGKTHRSYWPRKVKGSLVFERVTSGYSQTCGETSGNRAYCWGSNSLGQLGDGSGNPQLTPVAVAGGLLFQQLSAGNLFACGRTSTAQAYCWGYAFFGQLGTGSRADSPTPAAVLGPI